jgi:hypothetical protein
MLSRPHPWCFCVSSSPIPTRAQINVSIATMSSVPVSISLRPRNHSNMQHTCSNGWTLNSTLGRTMDLYQLPFVLRNRDMFLPFPSVGICFLVLLKPPPNQHKTLNQPPLPFWPSCTNEHTTSHHFTHIAPPPRRHYTTASNLTTHIYQ